MLLNNLSTIVAAQLESPGGGGAARASNTNPNPNPKPKPNPNPNPSPTCPNPTRWVNSLDPSKKKATLDSWTAEEDEALIEVSK